MASNRLNTYVGCVGVYYVYLVCSTCRKTVSIQIGLHGKRPPREDHCEGPLLPGPAARYADRGVFIPVGQFLNPVGT